MTAAPYRHHHHQRASRPTWQLLTDVQRTLCTFDSTYCTYHVLRHARALQRRRRRHLVGRADQQPTGSSDLLTVGTLWRRLIGSYIGVQPEDVKEQGSSIQHTAPCNSAFLYTYTARCTRPTQVEIGMLHANLKASVRERERTKGGLRPLPAPATSGWPLESSRQLAATVLSQISPHALRTKAATSPPYWMIPQQHSAARTTYYSMYQLPRVRMRLRQFWVQQGLEQAHSTIPAG